MKQAIEGFMPSVQSKLHAWIKEEVEGKPCLSCVWNHSIGQTRKEVVFRGEDDGFDAVQVARTLNKTMRAGKEVVLCLLELFESRNNVERGVGVEY